MAGTLKQVRLTRACGYGDVGTLLTPNATVRDWILQNNFGVVIATAHEAETPARPAKVSALAARKLAEITKSLFKG